MTVKLNMKNTIGDVVAAVRAWAILRAAYTLVSGRRAYAGNVVGLIFRPLADATSNAPPGAAAHDPYRAEERT